MADQKIRSAHELPPACQSGWQYHHIGIPTTDPRQDEEYLPHLKMYVSGFETSPYGIEWMRFEADCPISHIIQTTPHVAFKVDNLEEAIEGKTLIGEISSPSEGIRVAMFLDNGVPVEVLEFKK